MTGTFVLTSLLGFFFLGASAHASAPTCEYRNLYDRPDNPINSIPIYDQSELGTCYAYSASQMIDYELRKNGDPLKGKPVSPIWVAFNHKSHASKLQKLLTNSGDPDSLEYSSIKWAVDDIRDYGICDDAVVTRSLAQYKAQHRLTDDEFIFLFSKLWKKKIKMNTQDMGKLIDAMSDDPDVQDMLRKVSARYEKIQNKKALQGPAAACCDAQVVPMKEKIFLKKVVSDLKERMDAKRQAKNLLTFLRYTLFADCKGAHIARPELPKFKHFGEIFAGNRKIRNRIDDILDDAHSPRPVAVGYCSGILKDDDLRPNLNRVAILPRVVQLPSKKNCNPHYSILVGKRPSKDPGKNPCDYLLRNSYGTAFWTKNYECYCQESNGQRRNCDYEHDGNVSGIKVLGCWINGQELNRATFDVGYFIK